MDSYSILFDKSIDYEIETSVTESINDNFVILSKKFIRDVEDEKVGFDYHLFPNFLNNYLCDFIINESEKYTYKNITIKNPKGWTTTRHQNYPTTDLPIKDVDSISKLIENIVILDIFPLIEKIYNVNKYFLSCTDIFVVKYDATAQNKLEKHKDGSSFSFNILLNHEKNFKGGGTTFYKETGDVNILNTKGGLLLHCGQIMHSGNEIFQGERYILVGFIGYLRKCNSTTNYEKRLKLLFNNKNVMINNTANNENNLKSWKIKIDNNFQQDLYNIFQEDTIKVPLNSYILDTCKTNFTIIEKIVYELAIFHLKRMNLEVDFNRYKIEMWCKNNPQQKHILHCDKNELLSKTKNILETPILATITYINDSFYPLLLTNTDGYDDNIENLQIKLKNGVTLIFPKKMIHIAFNGKKLHGVFNIYKDLNFPTRNRKAIMFNIWDSYSHAPVISNNIEQLRCIEESTQLITDISQINDTLTNKIKLRENEMELFIKTILWNQNNIKQIISEVYDINKYGLLQDNNIIEFDI